MSPSFPSVLQCVAHCYHLNSMNEGVREGRGGLESRAVHDCGRRRRAAQHQLGHCSLLAGPLTSFNSTHLDLTRATHPDLTPQRSEVHSPPGTAPARPLLPSSRATDLAYLHPELTSPQKNATSPSARNHLPAKKSHALSSQLSFASH